MILCHVTDSLTLLTFLRFRQSPDLGKRLPKIFIYRVNNMENYIIPFYGLQALSVSKIALAAHLAVGKLY